MKRILLSILLTVLIMGANAQMPTLQTLIRYVNTPVADVTEEIVSKNGWELIKSTNVDSTIKIIFESKNASLAVKKYKDYDNEVYFFCDKPTYEKLNQSILALKPKLITSKVDENGYITRTYWGNKYGYKVIIAPKSQFSFHIFDKGSYYMMGLIESSQNSEKQEENDDSLTNSNVERGSGFGETPIALRKFTNLVVPADDGLKTGKIAVRISINKNGEVISATPGVKGTTLTDRELWQKCKEAIMGAHLTQSESAPEVQIGVVIFNFKLK